MAAAADPTGDLVDVAVTRKIFRSVEGEAITLQVDLGERFPIHAVSVSGTGPAGEAALRLTFSSDGQAWSEIEATEQSAAAGEVRAHVPAGPESWVWPRRRCPEIGAGTKDSPA